jgi:hypothetical protein
MLFTQLHKFFQSADFVAFVKEKQQNQRFEKLFFGGECRQKTYETASFKLRFA